MDVEQLTANHHPLWTDPPRDRSGTCGCAAPLLWDGRLALWRHLVDGSACVPTDPSSEVP